MSHITQKAQNALRGLLQRYGPLPVKRRLWNGEFSAGRWSQLEASRDESIHLLVEKYANQGGILDLGCGPGTTSLELDPEKYSSYTGVDISDVAIRKARNRAWATGRAGRNEYVQSDILNYVPARPYDVILYGESIYYVPVRRVSAMLDRYAACLTQSGVFVARLCELRGRLREIVDIIEERCLVVEKHLREPKQECVMVFRPRAGGAPVNL